MAAGGVSWVRASHTISCLDLCPMGCGDQCEVFEWRLRGRGSTTFVAWSQNGHTDMRDASVDCFVAWVLGGKGELDSLPCEIKVFVTRGR